jgi:apolipoprotein N-acyltransferase
MFGERIPLADTFPSLVDAIPGTSHYAAGDSFAAFPADNLLWVPSICYESIFSDFTRDGLNAPDGGGDVLLNLTNDVWFGDTAAADQHLMLQTMRAVEDRVWLVRATNTGISAFVAPTGQIVARTEINTSVVLYGEMSIPEIPLSFYRRHGNVIPLCLWVLGLLFLGYRWRKTTRVNNMRRTQVGTKDAP